jgi:hypothetical protein
LEYGTSTVCDFNPLTINIKKQLNPIGFIKIKFNLTFEFQRRFPLTEKKEAKKPPLEKKMLKIISAGYSEMILSSTVKNL